MSDILTYETWQDERVESFFNTNTDYFDVLKWAYNAYKEDIVYSCSFGAEGIVLIDLIYKINPSAKIYFLDTGLHFRETYELIEKVKTHYPTLKITMIEPMISLDEQSKWYGDELWKENPNLCCHMRKVVPLKEALSTHSAWISGLRRDQSESRKNTQYINKDETFKKIKICPLIHWKWEDILTYININNLPYNPLHDKGYPSIGCEVCTLPVVDSLDSRSGRWSNSTKTECGLHKFSES